MMIPMRSGRDEESAGRLSWRAQTLSRKKKKGGIQKMRSSHIPNCGSALRSLAAMAAGGRSGASVCSCELSTPDDRMRIHGNVHSLITSMGFELELRMNSAGFP
jgi:hypothetical protein